jgi:predicted ester cyclase
MSPNALADIYRGYIACLNAQDWEQLGEFVALGVEYNDKLLGLSGYRTMLERDYRQIPDLHFHIQRLVSEPPCIAARLDFNCTPVAEFLGLDVNGTRITFNENVIYEFREGKICRVWSVIDKAAIEAQLDSAADY